MHLKNVEEDMLLFLMDTTTEHWASGNKDGHNGVASGHGTRKRKFQPPTMMVEGSGSA